MIRIISGIHKGRRLQAPKKLPVRPTTDRAKEALFNILSNSYYFPDLKVLDLFSGTGNISYEFASRGCPQITAVDAHPGCVRFIDKTASELNLPISAVKRDVLSYLKQPNQAFDLVFADPPYDFSQVDLEQLIALAVDPGILKPGGLFVLEHIKDYDFREHLNFSEQRKYGGSVFSFFKAEEK